MSASEAIEVVQGSSRDLKEPGWSATVECRLLSATEIALSLWISTDTDTVHHVSGPLTVQAPWRQDIRSHTAEPGAIIFKVECYAIDNEARVIAEAKRFRLSAIQATSKGSGSFTSEDGTIQLEISYMINRPSVAAWLERRASSLGKRKSPDTPETPGVVRSDLWPSHIPKPATTARKAPHKPLARLIDRAPALKPEPFGSEAVLPSKSALELGSLRAETEPKGRKVISIDSSSEEEEEQCPQKAERLSQRGSEPRRPPSVSTSSPEPIDAMIADMPWSSHTRSRAPSVSDLPPLEMPLLRPVKRPKNVRSTEAEPPLEYEMKYNSRLAQRQAIPHRASHLPVGDLLFWLAWSDTSFFVEADDRDAVAKRMRLFVVDRFSEWGYAQGARDLLIQLGLVLVQAGHLTLDILGDAVDELERRIEEQDRISVDA